MSISIYYTARRSRPIDEAALAQITEVETKYGVEDKIESYLQTGNGLQLGIVLYLRSE